VKTRISVPSNSIALAKQRLWVPFSRVGCQSRSVGLDSGEQGVGKEATRRAQDLLAEP